MGEKAIQAEMRKLEGKLHDTHLKKRAKSNEYNRIFISHYDHMAHLSEPKRSYGYHNLLCDTEDEVLEPNGILINSSISLTQGSYYFDNHYHKTKLCPKCFKYVNPSDILRLEATRNRREGKRGLDIANQESNALIGYAEKLEKDADGLDNGSIQINLKENKDID